MEKSDNPTEAITEMIGAQDYTQWNGEFTYSDLKEGNTRVWTPLVWQAGRAMDRFTLSNMKLLNLKNDFSKFAIGAARTRKLCLGGLLSNADQSTFQVNGVNLNWSSVGNGLTLAHAAHTSAGYSGTQSNKLDLVLNEENLETACQAMFDFKDEDGKNASLSPDTLIVPTALRKTALEIIGGEGKVDTADNNPNIYYGSMKLIVLKEFRKQTGKANQPWIVCDDQMSKESLKWINRLESGDDYEVISWKNHETQMWKVGSIMWYTCGAYDWRPFVFSIPA